MELPCRDNDDRYLSDGSFSTLINMLNKYHDMHDLRIGIVYAFDRRTRMMPYWYADNRMVPCSVRTLADALDAAGFNHMRIILQQWTPKFRPSKAELDGKLLDILLISAMQVHAESAYDLIRNAHRLGKDRPLIIAGGPKAIYEPTDYFELGSDAGVSADCVVTGEAYVLMALLNQLAKNHTHDEHIRTTFERTRNSGALEHIPGLVYMSPESTSKHPLAVNTGVQQLLRDLDELPMAGAGYTLLEPPHRGTGLKSKPLEREKIHKYSPIGSLLSTQGCRFNCHYCSIPSYNQRTWRHKSARRFADEIQYLYEHFGIRIFFGTDDNFFNNRQTVIDLMEETSRRTTGGKPLASRIRFYTEATEFDVHRNQDILPLCRRGGLRAIWFGLEDLSGELVKKGQSAGKTKQLFAQLNELGIQPMAMVIHSDNQPLYSRSGKLDGLIDQAQYLFKNGTVSYQCTYLGPAVGTKSFEQAMTSNTLYKSVGGQHIPQAYYDGNHVVASGHRAPWNQQINVLRAYASFYNPVNMMKTIAGFRKDSISVKRIMYQVIGHTGMLLTIPRLAYWAWKLKDGPIEVYQDVPSARIPMVSPASGQQINWTFDRPLSAHTTQHPNISRTCQTCT